MSMPLDSRSLDLEMLIRLVIRELAGAGQASAAEQVAKQSVGVFGPAMLNDLWSDLYGCSLFDD